MKAFRDIGQEKEFVVTAELPIQLESSAAEIRHTVDTFAGVVDAVQVADDRAALGHMSGVVVATIALQQGVDAVLHISCRDRNRIALQADLLGAAAVGVTSVVLSRGGKLEKTDTQRAKGVFEIDAAGLTGIARVIGEEKKLVSPPGFFLGSQVTIFRPDEKWQAKRAQTKLDAGARFLQSQPCLDIEAVREYLARLIDQKITHRASVIVDVPLLNGVGEAQSLKKMQPGTLIDAAALKRLSESRSPLEDGVSICAEAIMALREVAGVSGVNIRHNGDPQNVISAVQRAGIKN